MITSIDYLLSVAGAYFHKDQPAAPNNLVDDAELRERLWQASVQAVRVPDEIELVIPSEPDGWPDLPGLGSRSKVCALRPAGVITRSNRRSGLSSETDSLRSGSPSSPQRAGIPAHARRDGHL